MARNRHKTAAPELAAILHDNAAFEAGLAGLERIDAGFVAAIRAIGARPALRRRAPGLEGLAWIVVSQQLSTSSATAIFGRVKARLGEIDAACIAATPDGDLRACGLSAGKVATLRAIVEAERSGALAIEALGGMEADAAHAALVAIKGIGPWTADIFLLFCLGHADAWPAGDLALQEAARLVLGLDERPDTKGLRGLGERWRPHRGVAAHCLWSYYHVARGGSATSAAPKTSSRRTAPKEP